MTQRYELLGQFGPDRIMPVHLLSGQTIMVELKKPEPLVVRVTTDGATMTLHGYPGHVVELSEFACERHAEALADEVRKGTLRKVEP